MNSFLRYSTNALAFLTLAVGAATSAQETNIDPVLPPTVSSHETLRWLTPTNAEVAVCGLPWFKENGGLTRANGDRFRERLLGVGGSKDPLEAYRDFRGRDADIQPLLDRRGLN